MNPLFLTQSSSLKLFSDLAKLWETQFSQTQSGYYLADSLSYKTILRDNPDIRLNPKFVVKEWDILRQARQQKPDLAKLRDFEKTLGDPVLWNAIVADRRLYYGPNSALEQDYRTRYSDSELRMILQTTLTELTALFDRLKPGVVIGFICVTIGEYIAYLIARARKIPYLNLRPTRIQNYFHAANEIDEPSHRIVQVYNEYYLKNIPENILVQVKKFLQNTQDSHAMYEGVMPSQKLLPTEKLTQAKRNPHLRAQISNAMQSLTHYLNPEFRYDNVRRTGMKYWLHRRTLLPLRLKKIQCTLKNSYVAEDDLKNLNYVFYPLHKEPEVTLLVYSRPFLNQIEVIRNLARSIPIDSILLVKEHPVALGYRPVTYYQKLLAIPNVRLVHPAVTSRSIVSGAKMVAVISGSIGLEAILLQKPVILFGKAPFSLFPASMVRTIGSLADLAEVVIDLQNNYRYDEKSVHAYIAGVLQTSVAVDFYTRLIGRSGYRNTSAGVGCNAETARSQQLKALTDYLITRCNESLLRGDQSSIK